MINSIRVLCILFFLHSFSYACGLCTVYSPLTQVKVNVNSDDNLIKDAKVTLVLTKEFTNSLLQVYDKNANNILDPLELNEVEKIFLEYVEPKNYFLRVYYEKIPKFKYHKNIKVENFESYVDNNTLHFTYLATLNLELHSDYFLKFEFIDKERFFLLSLVEANFLNQKDIIKEMNESTVIFNLNNISISPTVKSMTTIVEKAKEETKDESTYLDNFSQLLKLTLLKIEKGDTYALVTLLAVSFLYGVLHALGPGHSKAFAFSYFSIHKTSLKEAFLITQVSAFIHIIAALILVLVSFFILDSILNNFVANSIEILTIISAIMIMLLSLFLLFKRAKKKTSCACHSCCSTEQKADPKKKREDLWFILTAGLIPCPGTVLLFIYAFTLKTYYAVILASFMISFGMGCIVFASASLGLGLNKVSSISHKFSQSMMIIAPVFMFILGLILLVGTVTL